MKQIYEYLIQDINKVEDNDECTFNKNSRFWIRAIDDVKIYSEGKKLIKVSIDGENWDECKSYELKAGNSIFLYRYQQAVDKIHYNKLGSSGRYARFDIGGNIVGFISEISDKRNFLMPEGLANAFQFSGVVHADQLVLPFKTIGSFGCADMFNNCEYLISAPELPATDLSEYAYSNMFTCCYRLANPPKRLPALDISKGAYSNMFTRCSDMKEAPIIKAKTISVAGCVGMFSGCKSLKKVECHLEGQIDYRRIENWLSGTLTGTFIKIKDSKYAKNSTNGIPKGWTIKEI